MKWKNPLDLDWVLVRGKMNKDLPRKMENYPVLQLDNRCKESLCSKFSAEDFCFFYFLKRDMTLPSMTIIAIRFSITFYIIISNEIVKQLLSISTPQMVRLLWNRRVFETI